VELTGLGLCLGGWGLAAKPERCGLQCSAFSYDAVYCFTHPSFVSNVGPSARRLSCYLDVVPVG